MGNLLENKLFVFAVFMSMTISFVYLFGVSSYSTTDINGVTVTQPQLNNYGIVILALPIVGYLFYYLKKRRWDT